MKHLLVLSVLVALLTGVAVSGAEKYSKKDYQTAYDLFEAMDFRKNMDESIVRTLDRRKNQPNIDVMGPILLEFYRKYCSYDAMKKELAEIYLKNFSADELREMTEFYRTPTGKKVSKKQSEISQASFQLGQEIARKHLPELQEQIRKKMNSQKVKNPPKTKIKVTK